MVCECVERALIKEEGRKLYIENQLTGDSFYEIYSTVLKSKKQKNRILPETK